MKHKIIFFTALFIFITCGCSRSDSITVKANENPPSKGVEKSGNQLTDHHTSDDFQSIEDKAKLTKVDVQSPLIWYGEISDEDLTAKGKIQKNTNYAMLTKSPLDRLESSFEVDVINCAGYLYSAVMSKHLYEIGETPEERWQYEVLPDSIALDASAKIKRCDAFQNEKPNEIVSSDALAIAPRDKNRRNIKTENIDLNKLFSSLPNSAKELIDPNTKERNAESKLKEKLMIGASDNWVNTDNWIDFDGDGEIDFVKVVGFDKNLLKSKAENALIHLYFQRVTGKWKEIARIK